MREYAAQEEIEWVGLKKKAGEFVAGGREIHANLDEKPRAVF